MRIFCPCCLYTNEKNRHVVEKNIRQRRSVHLLVLPISLMQVGHLFEKVRMASKERHLRLQIVPKRIGGIVTSSNVEQGEILVLLVVEIKSWRRESNQQRTALYSIDLPVVSIQALSVFLRTKKRNALNFSREISISTVDRRHSRNRQQCPRFRRFLWLLRLFVPSLFDRTREDSTLLRWILFVAFQWCALFDRPSHRE